MDKKALVEYLDELFKPYGFKRKGNRWSQERDSLIKLVCLQKSKYSNSFYLNYGFIIIGLKLTDLEMHVYNRLGSLIDSENDRIKELLDLNGNIPDEQRKSELKSIVEKHLLEEFVNINCNSELYNALKKRKHLNDIPLIVKEYFNFD